MSLEPSGRKSHAITNAQVGGRRLFPYIYIGRQRPHAALDTIELSREPVQGSLDRQSCQGVIVKKKPALVAVPYVESEWLRYVIQDERERYWTGRGFVKDQRKALTYADALVVVRDMRRILRKRCKGLTRYRLVAPLIIDVYADGPIDKEEMTWFLSQNCFVSMNRLGTAEGPGDSVVLPLVDWKQSKMMKD